MSAFDSAAYEYWLDEAARRAGLVLSSAQTGHLLCFIEMLLAKNKVMDLTNITEPEELALKHLLDSWLLLPVIDRLLQQRKQRQTLSVSQKENCATAQDEQQDDQAQTQTQTQESAPVTLVDVGSGAGFPGLPLKFVRPELQVLLLDAQRKRVDFLCECLEKLELTGIEARQLRAEEAGRLPELRDSFDLVTARAVAALPQLAELCLPLTASGGYFLAMKGRTDEADQARPAVTKLSGRICEVKRYLLPGTDMQRSLIIIEKIAPTAKVYPRSFARIKNNPLH
ncbi:MAG: 16S rRNA (guanine(527)-N(7))-methyltransferase RsmG [Clostridiaceae bacterium]|nr:16S rRNA (guanine(527)-N(7))-methyltransferase RsmG [Clostridiaceae bacterium]